MVSSFRRIAVPLVQHGHSVLHVSNFYKVPGLPLPRGCPFIYTCPWGKQSPEEGVIMKQAKAVRFMAMAILGIMLVAVFASCANGNAALVNEYKSISKQLQDAVTNMDLPKVQDLSAKLEEIGKKLEKAKLSPAQKKDIEDFATGLLDSIKLP